MIIFDIGGNVGDFTNKCLEVYPNCSVILVEANDKLIQKLKERFLNKNVEVLNYLVSSVDDEDVDFFVCEGHTISTASINWITSSRFSKTHTWETKKTKKTITLDKLIELYGNPDLIKIDVEGYESEVIKGLSKKQKEICFEWAEEVFIDTQKVCQHLEKLGYENFGVLYNDEYLKKPKKYSEWSQCEIHSNINPNRKEKWGMIWVK
jgi:FkbM family methyltransferase